jgi:hypothetical protein
MSEHTLDDEYSLYTLEEAAAYLRCQSQWLGRQISSRNVACIRIGRKRYMTRAQILKMIKDGQQAVMVMTPESRDPGLSPGALARRGLNA